MHAKFREPFNYCICLKGSEIRLSLVLPLLILGREIGTSISSESNSRPRNTSFVVRPSVLSDAIGAPSEFNYHKKNII